MCDWFNKFYGFPYSQLFYMTLAIDKMDGHGHINCFYLLSSITYMVVHNSRDQQGKVIPRFPRAV